MHFTHYARALKRNIMESAQNDPRIRNYDPSSMSQCGTALPLNNGVTGQGGSPVGFTPTGSSVPVGTGPPAPAAMGPMGLFAPGTMGIPEPFAPGITAPGALGYKAPGAFESTAPLGTGSLGPPASSFVRRPGRPRTGKRPILKD